MTEKIKEIENYLDFLDDTNSIISNYNSHKFNDILYNQIKKKECCYYNLDYIDSDDIDLVNTDPDDIDYGIIGERAYEQYKTITKIFEEIIRGIQKSLLDLRRGHLEYIADDFEVINRNVSDNEFLLNNFDIVGIDYKQLNETISCLVKMLDKTNQFVSKQELSLPPVLEDLTNDLISHLTINPELLRKINPRLFEKLIFEIFKKFKMDVQLTKRTRDGGYDIIAFEDNFYTKNSYIIECKRFNSEKKVGIDIVQRLYGVKMGMSINKAFLVTSSFFTKDALNFAKQHIWDIDLKDYNDIIKWLRYFW